VRNFDGALIHCMSNGLDVAYQLEQTTVWRNSDDFFPKKTSSAQQTHIHTNAINNLWTSTFALPDWDMFQSHHRWAEFHAAARALSGGPVYVCDKPARQNFDILRRLASTDGRVWRCDRPALPAAESIFADCRREEVLLKIHNRSANVGLIGMFHCSEARKRLAGSFSPADVSDVRGTTFITRRYPAGILADRFHPLRVILISLTIGLCIAPVNIALVFLRPHVSLPTAQDISIFTSVAGLPWSTLAAASEVALFMRLLPQDRYGQFCSANAMVRAIALIMGGTVVGYFLDSMKVLDAAV
jgi:hypothetical protein